MASFAAEWAQLKADGCGAGLPASCGPRRRQRCAGLRSDRSVWNAAGSDVALLAGDTTKALAGLDGGQQGLGADAGAEGASAQRELHKFWQKYLHALGDSCDGLQDLI